MSPTLIVLFAATTTVNTDFTLVGKSGNTFGTNFVVGRYYVLDLYSGTSYGISLTGATLLKQYSPYAAGGIYIYSIIIKATATTVSNSYSIPSVVPLCEIY